MGKLTPEQMRAQIEAGRMKTGQTTIVYRRILQVFDLFSINKDRHLDVMMTVCAFLCGSFFTLLFASAAIYYFGVDSYKFLGGGISILGFCTTIGLGVLLKIFRDHSGPGEKTKALQEKGQKPLEDIGQDGKSIVLFPEVETK